ncbi:hypothetical protein COX00_02375 [Candidatus Uhrbacteria bacterium CG22_combo_CG10-13_8_21_14_all_47_17]|uniref:PDZ domain-containing protein n=1 Tax=Candidatus Uhrbacteria bacterium CG22_combo_CG10-13_8_21_14_all_47_17 TaxID=1975041 RepID=A0A2H0BSG3_9BACT|nr:MAG: hypothetical protein COX00_02375 [Candidatus Uhrbacteria bacterium CG22_combo_CG10-13_8_21_14_all_47_17]
MQTALIFLLILSVLVLVHEIGHYVAARIFGVKAEEFGYGFPPRATGIVKVDGKWKKVSSKDRTEYKNTVWSFNWLPLGGFVRLKGEQGENENDPDSFLAKRGWQKFIILAAGVCMNLVLAAVIFTGGFLVGVPSDLQDVPQNAQVSDKYIEITYVLPDSAADQAGLQVGDTISSINGTVPTNTDETRALLQTDVEGTTYQLDIHRNGGEQTIEASSKQVNALNRPGLGVMLADVGIVRLPIHLAIAEGVAVTFGYTRLIVSGLASLVKDLVVHQQVSADVSGPVGIAILTGTIARQGTWALLHFTALLSINLAVINFLPIPALDGGRAVFVVIEGLRRKRNNPQLEGAIHQIGFIVLIVLIILVTAHDIGQYGGMIWNGFLGIVGLN